MGQQVIVMLYLARHRNADEIVDHLRPSGLSQGNRADVVLPVDRVEDAVQDRGVCKHRVQEIAV